MLRNLMITLAYDGADFHGWQRQPGLRTVQETLEMALRRSLRHQITLLGCSRTDSGVHASAHVANVYTANPLPAHIVMRSIGSRLPKDMTLLNITEVPLTFHATRSANSKLYRYRIHNSSGRPCEHQQQRFVYHCWQPLNVEKMREAAAHWVGTHDFTSFASSGNDRESNVRTIFEIDVYRHGLEVRLDFHGAGFLYKQVRNMVGTLVEMGLGKKKVQQAPEILAAKSRYAASGTAPARGLCLQWVEYHIPYLPQPSPEMLHRAALAEPPKGAERARMDHVPTRGSLVPPEVVVEEEPCA